MAFPTIPTSGAGRILANVQADTTATRTFPSLTGLTKNAGDLLIAMCLAYQGSAATEGAAFSAWTAGWTEFVDVGNNTQNAMGMAYKWSTGSETGTITVTQAATVTGHVAMFVMSIAGAHASTPPADGEPATYGTTAAADPPSFDPAAWAAEDTLWIMVGVNGETSLTGTFDGITGSPTNYVNALDSGISADVIGGVAARVCFRQLNAAAEDPGPFVCDISNARNAAILLAVRPAPAGAAPGPAPLRRQRQPYQQGQLVRTPRSR